mgnify:CR=1 FL=1
MSRTALDTAKRFIKRRKFAEALKILEDSTTAEDYKEVYDYFFTTGVAYLYEGEIGNAKAYFEKANRIRLTDPLLMDMFAVLHLRNRDTINATCKYLEAQDYDPEDVLAKRGLEFLKNKGTPEEIARLLSSGEIKKFYPPLGVNPDIIMFSVLAVVFGVLLAIGILFFNGRLPRSSRNVDWSAYTVQTYSDYFDDDVDSVYELKDREIKKSWEKMKSFIEEERDNAALVEINRLLNSNASSEVKNQVSEAAKLIREPDLMNLKDNFSLQQVLSEPVLYSGCFVYWEGRIMNEIIDSDGYRFDLIIEDESNNKMLGLPVKFSNVPSPPLDTKRPIRIFGSISLEKGRIFLNERSYYQSIR